MKEHIEALKNLKDLCATPISFAAINAAIDKLTASRWFSDGLISA